MGSCSMTWTATEEATATEISTYVWGQSSLLICELHAGSDDPAAIEQMRAHAKLIVQAEAMLEALEWYADHQNWKDVVGKYPPKTSWGALDGGKKARAIIKATGGEE